ncbi:MAG TPA: glycoside hydrolase family 172 protein [Chloroflexota bacterium]
MTDPTAAPGSASWLFREMATLRPHRTERASSWDRSGRNRDFLTLEPGSTTTLAEIDGAGSVQYFYAAIGPGSPDFLRGLVLRMYWDGEEQPSVEAPFGDFFGVAHGKIRYFTSLLLAVNPGGFGAGACDGFSCYFPMPFANGARITITNDHSEPLPALWYHVNYERYQRLDPQLGRFHAQWRRSNSLPAVEQPTGALFLGQNLTGEQNYTLLEAEGQGNLAGILLQVDNVEGGWWGEGDDMIFVDGERWPPAYHGTGTEEVFGGGACPSHEYSGPYHGFHLISDELWSGKTGAYRFYVHDPVRFQKSIRVSVEHGHNNDYANDYASVAYWYQREPHRPFEPLRPFAERLPRMPAEYEPLRARERALVQRVPRATDRREWIERSELRVRVIKPIRQALWAEDWPRARELLDAAEEEIARLEAGWPRDRSPGRSPLD